MFAIGKIKTKKREMYPRKMIQARSKIARRKFHSIAVGRCVKRIQEKSETARHDIRPKHLNMQTLFFEKQKS